MATPSSPFQGDHPGCILLGWAEATLSETSALGFLATLWQVLQDSVQFSEMPESKLGILPRHQALRLWNGARALPANKPPGDSWWLQSSNPGFGITPS